VLAGSTNIIYLFSKQMDVSIDRRREKRSKWDNCPSAERKNRVHRSPLIWKARILILGKADTIIVAVAPR